MQRIGNRGEEATAAGVAANCFAWHGEPAQARAYSDRAVALARELTNPFAEAAALDCRGFVHDQQGAWPQDFGAARRVAEAAGDQFRVYIVNLQESWTHSKAGNPAAGRALVEQGLRFAEKIGTVFYLALGKAWLAACAVALGDGTAPALCRDALLEAEKTSDRLAQAVAYCALAEALAQDRAAPDRAPAEEAMAETIRLYKEIEFNPELARTYVSYARFLQGWGRTTKPNPTAPRPSLCSSRWAWPGTSPGPKRCWPPERRRCLLAASGSLRSWRVPNRFASTGQAPALTGRRCWWRSSTGWRRRPQEPGRASNTPGSVVPQLRQRPSSARRHPVSSNQSRPISSSPQPWHQVLPPVLSWTLPV
jgi:hypothetical protein